MPRMFISYSWSSLTHEEWVIELASRLREDGVDVILDKWDLKPGDDAYAFMESMVTDPTVEKVLMICDATYTAKANNRAGGVGTESQIISAELYGRTSQERFAALVTDDDANGKPNIPVFYKGRIYFDFRSSSSQEDAYDKVIRWFYNKPLNVKPKIGKMPDHLLDTAPVATATSSKAKRAEEAIRQNAANAHALIREYGIALIEEMRACAPVEVSGEPFDNAVLASVASMRPYLHQFVEIVENAIRFSEDQRPWSRLLDILEQMGTLMFRGEGITSWRGDQFDSYSIIAHEAFLCVIALCLDEERFDLAQAALSRRYLVGGNTSSDAPSTSDFCVFWQNPESLSVRNQRQQIRRLVPQADLLEQSHKLGAKPPFESLMQADFLLYLRSDGDSYSWYPVTLVYAARRYKPFSVFARSESASYFAKLVPLLGEATADDAKRRIARIAQSAGNQRLYQFDGIPAGILANLKNIGISL